MDAKGAVEGDGNVISTYWQKLLARLQDWMLTNTGNLCWPVSVGCCCSNNKCVPGNWFRDSNGAVTVW